MCSQKLLDSAKKSATAAIKTDSKTANQKTAEVTQDLIGYKKSDKIVKVSKELHSKSTKQLHLQNDNEIETPKKKDIYLQKKGNKLLMN